MVSLGRSLVNLLAQTFAATAGKSSHLYAGAIDAFQVINRHPDKPCFVAVAALRELNPRQGHAGVEGLGNFDCSSRVCEPLGGERTVTSRPRRSFHAGDEHPGR
jgi:hypothetical protein